MRYTVTGVAEQVRDWNSTAGGPMRAYRIDLKGSDGTEELLVEWSRKATSAAPTVGLEVDGEIEDGKYGKKLKLVNRGGSYMRGPEDPKRQASIIRQHSQTAALTVLTLKQQLGELTAEDLTPAKIQQLADWFDDDVRHGVARSGA